jgi:hypothetical protein
MRHRAARWLRALGRAEDPAPPLALGLQGGGALGAFTIQHLFALGAAAAQDWLARAAPKASAS